MQSTNLKDFGQKKMRSTRIFQLILLFKFSLPPPLPLYVSNWVTVPTLCLSACFMSIGFSKVCVVTFGISGRIKGSYLIEFSIFSVPQETVGLGLLDFAWVIVIIIKNSKT